MTQSNPNETASESIGFLKSLNELDGQSFEVMINSMMKCLTKLTRRDNNEERKEVGDENELELLYRLFIMIMINTNGFKAGALMRKLLTLETRYETNKNSSLDEGILVKIRQEVSPFHEQCFAEAVKSLINYLTEIEPDEDKLTALVHNMVLVNEWDIQNKCSMK